MRLDKVTSFILDKLVTQKLQDGRLDNSGGLSPKTVQNIVIIIKSAFKFAHREFHIPNVAENIGLPRGHWKPHPGVGGEGGEGDCRRDRFALNPDFEQKFGGL